MKILIILLAMVCTNLHAEPTNSVHLPSITHVWANEESANLAPISIEEVAQCMGKESSAAKDYAAFNEAANLLNVEGMRLESLSKTMESERVGLNDAFKKLNEKIAQLNDNSKRLDLIKTEINALVKQKLDAKQAKEANERIVNYNQMVSEQNENAKNANRESDILNAKQSTFNEKVVLAKRDFDQYNQKADAFEQRREAFNAKLTAYIDKCSGEKRLVK